MSSTLSPRLPKIAQPWALKNLPPFRPVATKLVRLTSQTNIPIDEVQRVLRTDLAFSAEVLRLANSALIGSRSEIHSIGQAIEILGLERLKAIAMTIALRDLLPSAKNNSFLQQCWNYNLATAVICEWLARLVGLEPDACYTAGLIHDIGRLAILQAFPKEYELGVLSIEEYDFDLLRCEKAVFEIDHCEAGSWLLDHWGFPTDLCEAAAFHHIQPGPESPALVHVVFIAWQMADMLGLSPLATRSADTIEEITANLPEAARERIFARLPELPDLVLGKLKAAESLDI